MEYFFILFLWYYVGFVTVQCVNEKYTLYDDWKTTHIVKKWWFVTTMPILYIVMGAYSTFKK